MKYSIIFFFLLIPFCTFGQTQYNPCGFKETKEFMDRIDILKAQSLSLAKTTGATDTIPLAVHLVGTDSGTGYQPLELLFQNICELNTRFEPANIYFFIQWPIEYLANSNYYNHTNFLVGENMMLLYNRSNAINVYWVDGANGYCGYYSPDRDAITIANFCAGIGGTTFAHEIGHLFQLPHTFYGWEYGQVPDTPELVTRGAGANCSYAADKFCDTEADFISNLWSCPYSLSKRDTNNDLYHPDSSLYMSYSTNSCRSRFSNEQIGVMRADKGNRYPSLDHNYLSYQSSFDSTIGLSTGNDTLYHDGTMKWQAVKNANAYHLRVSEHGRFQYIVDTMVYTNEYAVPQGLLKVNQGYDVRLIPYNNTSLCNSNTSFFQFTYSDQLRPNSIHTQNPNFDWTALAEYSNGRIILNTQSRMSRPAHMSILNLLSSVVDEMPLHINSGRQRQELEVTSLSPGIYILKIDVEANSINQKILVQ